MEQRFSNNSLDIETLREFCKREGFYHSLLLPILQDSVPCGADGLLGDAHDADDLASFLCITPQMLSKIRKNISFGAQK